MASQGAAGMLQLSNPGHNPVQNYRSLAQRKPKPCTIHGNRWSFRIALNREGMMEVTVVNEATTEVGPDGRLSPQPLEPAVVAPGSTVTLRTQAMNSVGRGASNRTRQFFSDPRWRPKNDHRLGQRN